MTIASQPVRHTYLCAGTNGPYIFPTRFLAESDLAVTHITTGGLRQRLVLHADYSVSGAGDSGGGEVTTLEAFEDGQIEVWLDVAITQDTAYTAGDAFPAEAHEAALDKLTLIAAQQDAALNELSAKIDDMGPAGVVGGGGAPGLIDLAAHGVVADGIRVGQKALIEGLAGQAAAAFTNLTGKALSDAGVIKLDAGLNLRNANLDLGLTRFQAATGFAGPLITVGRDAADLNSRQTLGSRAELYAWAGDPLAGTNSSAVNFVLQATGGASVSPLSRYDFRSAYGGVALHVKGNVEKVRTGLNSINDDLVLKLEETAEGSTDSCWWDINAANYERLIDLSYSAVGADISARFNLNVEGQVATAADVWVVQDENGKGTTYAGNSRSFNGTGGASNAFFYFYQAANDYADFAQFDGVRMIHHYGRSLYMRSLRRPTGDLILKDSANGRLWNNTAVSVPGPAFHVGRVVTGGSFRPSLYQVENQVGILWGDDNEWSVACNFGPATVEMGNLKPIDDTASNRFPTAYYAHHFYRGDRNSWSLADTHGGLKISGGVVDCTIKEQATLLQVGYPVDLSDAAGASFTLLIDGACSFGELRSAQWLTSLSGDQTVQVRAISDYGGLSVSYRRGRFRLGGCWRASLKTLGNRSSDLNRDFRERGLMVGCSEDVAGNGAAAGQTFTAADKLSFGGQPSVNDTLTLSVIAPGGALTSTTITFKASGASGNQVNIGATAADTAANLNALVNANAAVFGLSSVVSGTLLTLAAGAEGAVIEAARSGAYPGISNWTCANAGGPSIQVGYNAFNLAWESHLGSTPSAGFRNVYDRLLYRLDEAGILNFDGSAAKSAGVGLWLLGMDTQAASLKSLIPARSGAYYDGTMVGSPNPTWTRKHGVQFLPSTLTFGGRPTDGDTLTINGVTLTFKTTVTNAATQCAIGADPIASATNLVAWITLNTALLGNLVATQQAPNGVNSAVVNTIASVNIITKSGVWPAIFAPAYISTTIDLGATPEGTGRDDLLLVALPRGETSGNLGSKNGNVLGTRDGRSKLKTRDGSSSGTIGTTVIPPMFPDGASLMPTVKMVGRVNGASQFFVDRGRITAVSLASTGTGDILDIGRGGGAVCSEELWAAGVFPASLFVDAANAPIGERLLSLDRALREAHAATQLLP